MSKTGLEIIDYSERFKETHLTKTLESGHRTPFTQPRSDKLFQFILEVGCGGFQVKKSTVQYKKFLHTITASSYINKDKSRWTPFFKKDLSSEDYLGDINDLEFIREKLASIQPKYHSVLEEILRNIEGYINES